jgi:hypothetical protein
MAFVIQHSQHVCILRITQCAFDGAANLNRLVYVLRINSFCVPVTKVASSTSWASTARKVDTNEACKLSSGCIYNFSQMG